MEGFIAAVVGILIALWLIGTFPGTAMLIGLAVGGFFAVRYVIRLGKAETARLAAVQERERARRANEEAQRLADERRRAAEQLEFGRRIISVCNESTTAFGNIPKHLMTAEELISTAENEFQDGVFSPFWDSIEKATCKLGEIDGSIKLIRDHSIQYKSLATSYTGKIPPFPVDPASAHRFGTANDTSTRHSESEGRRKRLLASSIIAKTADRNCVGSSTNLANAAPSDCIFSCQS